MRLTIAAALSSVPLACFADAPVRAGGHSRREAREVAAFDGVEVASGIHARVSIGPRKVEVEAADDVVPLVETRVDDGRVLVLGKASSRVRTSGGSSVRWED